MNKIVHHLHCHGCGAHYERIELAHGDWARCARCGQVLETYTVLGPREWLALILTALISFVVANAYPDAALNFQGLTQSASFLEAVRVTWSVGYPQVAVMTFAVGFFLPIVHLLLLLSIFIPLSCHKLPGYFESALFLVHHLKQWCMVPVLLIGILVSAVKLAGVAALTPGIGLFATAFAAVLLTLLGRLDQHKIYLIALDMGLPVKPEKKIKPPSPSVISRTWALLCAAAILYIPANFLPIMSVSGVGGQSAHTILGGIIELCEMGSWDVAAIVFIASMIVPIFKLLAMSWLVWQTQRASAQHLRVRTRLYVFVELIGQWSMLDVFVVILLCALVRFGSLMRIEPSAGAAAFGAVVVLTMVAAMGFDPRLAWRRAGHRRYFK